MASRVQVHNPEPGYFWTDDFEDVIQYVINYLCRYNHSINFIIHGASIFTRDDEEQEIHMAPSAPVLLDPETPDIRNRLELLYDEIHDPESWNGLDGSGWSIVPGTMSYWFKIIPFQPNNTPNETTRNVRDPPDVFFPETSNDNSMEVDDPPPSTSTSNDNTGTSITYNVYDSLLLAIAMFYVPNNQKLSKVRQLPKLINWLVSEGFNEHYKFGDKITPGNIASWHENVGKYSLQVFSNFGNVIYLKYNEDCPLINLLWANRKFKLITNLNALLQEKSDRIFCNLCRKFHRTDGNCDKKIIAISDPVIDVPEFPEGRHALVCYADFESIVKKNNEHYCSGYGLIAIDKTYDKINEIYLNYNEENDLLGSFIRNIFAIAESYAFDTIQYMTAVPPVIGAGIKIAAGVLMKKMKWTYKCEICDQEISDRENYITGRNFINGNHGKHHVHCWEDPKNSLMTYFHNFRGYDSHYVLQQLMKDTRYKCKFIRGKSFEKFDIISATTRSKDNHLLQVTFKDTFNYLATSIAKLVKQVEKWRYTPEIDRDDKGTFPYKWFDDFDKLTHNQLPPLCDWYNDITQTNIDPRPAYDLWKREKFNTFSDFHNYYMKCDVLQLADIFEEFRESCLNSFNLDPVYFQGAPSFTWQLSLKQAADKMFIIPDVSVYTDIQQNIRGGIAQVMHRYVNIEKNPDECILFLDVNSLYSKCMTYKLPTNYMGKINTLDPNWQSMYGQNYDLTAILCVDLTYPAHLHDNHIAYPLAPHKYDGRLCTTFLDKIKYLCHVDALNFYVNEGLIITKFHYGYLFKQDYILKDYVNANIDKRRATSSPPLKTLYKLLNNSLYGKTCENKFKYRKFEVHNEEKGWKGKINRYLSNAVNWLPINDKVLIEKKNTHVKLDKPIQIGFAVLELAKLELYKFLFNVQSVCDDNEIAVQPLYTDTDSIIFHFSHPNPEEILFNDPRVKPLLDFDKVPDHWKVHTPGTHKQSGLWSLETTERIIEFIGLRAKTYCYRVESNRTVLKNKGITTTATELKTRDKITMEHYKQALFHNKEVRVYQVLIASKKHKLLTHSQSKLALTNNEEKRQVLADKITTIPFGYKGNRYGD